MSLAIQSRPLTVEEYVVAGISLKHCMRCGRDKAHNESGWVYYREAGKPQVLCERCFERECASIAGAAVFASQDASACHEPQDAHRISGLQQITPEQLDRVLREFRNLTADEIHHIGMQVPCRASAGDCLELFGPISWGMIFWCLKWLREIHDLPLRFLFGRWEKLPAVLNDKMVGPAYEGWRSRLVEFAKAEFLYRYSVLLSDATEAAYKKAEGKKAADAKRKIFEAAKTSVCEHAPPESLAGAADELQRFVEYMNLRLARLDAKQ